jgi:hypothetical protein
MRPSAAVCDTHADSNAGGLKVSRIGIGFIGLGLAVKPHALALRDIAAKVDVIGGHCQLAAIMI